MMHAAASSVALVRANACSMLSPNSARPVVHIFNGLFVGVSPGARDLKNLPLSLLPVGVIHHLCDTSSSISIYFGQSTS